MISVTSKPTYTSKDQKLVVYETTVEIDSESTAQLMAELQAVLRSILSSTQLKMDEAIKISEILAQEANTLAQNVQRMMGGEDLDQNTDTGSSGL